MKTVSEIFFEKICKRRGISFHPIERGKNRTPDYRILLAGTEVIVEVKQLDLNKEDKERYEQVFKEGKIVTFFPRAKSRFREKIKSSSGQLKNITKGVLPSILVLFDNTGGFSCLDKYSILTGMYGDETLAVMMPDNPEFDPVMNGCYFGGNRQMTERERRYISAVGLIRMNNDNDPELDLYHNIFASLPLKAEIVVSIASRQYTLPQGNTEVFREWVEIV
jgi:hypothetical protein